MESILDAVEMIYIFPLSHPLSYSSDISKETLDGVCFFNVPESSSLVQTIFC